MSRATGLDICVVASSRFPIREPFAGGLEAHTHGLARELRRRGHRVTLFAAPGSDPLLGARELAVRDFASSDAARLDVAAPAETWMSEHHAYLGLMLDLAASTRRFDLVHNNSLHHLPIAMAATLDVPVVTTLHTPPLPWLESAMAYAPATCRFITVSQAMASAWSPVVSSTTIRNGVDTDRWRRGPGGSRAVWSGRLVPEKAPHDAIDAAALAGVPLDLVGPIMDRAYFDTEIRPRLHAGARWLGHLSQDALRRVVGAARVALVTPAWQEPFGLVAIEAMSTGTPVAAYARGALPEIVTEARTGALAPAGDVAALADALHRAAACDRAVVRATAVAHWSLDSMVTEYERVYLEAASKDLVA